MSKLNMTRIAVLLLWLVAVVQCQKLCKHEYNTNSPLYWEGEADLCTDELCQKYPDLRCNDYNETSLAEEVSRHYGPEDILAEVAAMQKYFNTYLPDNQAYSNYECEGVCDRRPTLLKRVLTTIKVFDLQTETYVKKRWMCHVVGPKIYQRECRGRCKVLYGTPGMFCVPEVTVSIDVWVFCPDVHQGCRRIRTKVPLSCACKHIQCLADPPPGPLPLPWLPEGVSTSTGQVNFGSGLVPGGSSPTKQLQLKSSNVGLGPKEPDVVDIANVRLEFGPNKHDQGGGVSSLKLQTHPTKSDGNPVESTHMGSKTESGNIGQESPSSFIQSQLQPINVDISPDGPISVDLTQAKSQKGSSNMGLDDTDPFIQSQLQPINVDFSPGGPTGVDLTKAATQTGLRSIGLEDPSTFIQSQLQPINVDSSPGGPIGVDLTKDASQTGLNSMGSGDHNSFIQSQLQPINVDLSPGGSTGVDLTKVAAQTGSISMGLKDPNSLIQSELRPISPDIISGGASEIDISKIGLKPGLSIPSAAETQSFIQSHLQPINIDLSPDGPIGIDLVKVAMETKSTKSESDGVGKVDTKKPQLPAKTIH